MLYFKKSQPAPSCLAEEKKKGKSGKYDCGHVLDRLEADFKNKCYICEQKGLNDINVEHFKPHEGGKNLDLMFDWNNLFWACSHCNNTKRDRYRNILDCTDKTEDPELILKHCFSPFPGEKVRIEIIEDSEKAQSTRDLLLEVYNNGTTPRKIKQARNLRQKLLDDIFDFQNLLYDYFRDTIDDADKVGLLKEIKAHLNPASRFTAFKRWIVRDNEELYKAFKEYLDD